MRWIKKEEKKVLNALWVEIMFSLWRNMIGIFRTFATGNFIENWNLILCDFYIPIGTICAMCMGGWWNINEKVKKKRKKNHEYICALIWRSIFSEWICVRVYIDGEILP